MKFDLGDGNELELDEAAIGEIARSPEVRALVTDAANNIAAIAAQSRDVGRVFVDAYTTDRAAASVTVQDYSGDDELVRGVLSDAAIAAGLEFEAR